MFSQRPSKSLIAGRKFLKSKGCLRVDGISVRMALRRKFSECLLNLGKRGLLAKAKCPPSLIDGLKFDVHDVEIDEAVARQWTRVTELQDSPMQVSQPIDGRLEKLWRAPRGPRMLH